MAIYGIAAVVVHGHRHLLSVMWIVDIVLVIMAAINASDGEAFRYPMTIRFIK